MRCLYCGKELALLKRLRGGGDFCSDAHKHSYQEEYNRLALSRLLQAQKKGQQTTSPAQNTPPPNAVAVEEPVAPALEESVSETEDTQVLAQSNGEVAVEEESAPEVEVEADDVADEEEPESAEPEPVEIAGFLLESPALAALAEETPYLESWLELSVGPAMSPWAVQNESAFRLSSADLLSLDLRPQASSSIEDRTFSPDVLPQAFPGVQPDPHPLTKAANTRKIAKTNRLAPSGGIAVDIAPSSIASAADQTLAEAIGFESAVMVDESELLELSPTAIDFPAENSDVVVQARPETRKPEPASEDDTPRASLEALSRLHQEMAEQEAARIEEAATERRADPLETPVEVVEARSLQLVAAPEVVRDVVEIQAEEAPRPSEDARKPNYTTELFEISIKTFPPAKAALIAGEPFPSQIAPLLPHLKSLPVRPKVALATGYVPPGNAKAGSETKPAATPAPPAVRTQGPSKPMAGGKSAARLTQPKQPVPTGGPAQPAAKTPGPRTVAAPKAAAPKTDATKPVIKPVAPQPAPVPEPVAARVTVLDAAPNPTPAAEAAKPVADPVKTAAQAPAKPTPEQKNPAEERTKTSDNVPSFDIAQPANNSWLGSLKVKLGLAIVLLVIACGYFLGWGGGKAPKSGSNPAADGSGPSIIMGEGGWVEGWAGDPAGMHAGRQITIYRPSLKLSDYRLEFQASIDAKSAGWVFRAADPNNYYAMKLMTVSSGLTTKVALFKYLVANGKQTQVGRVPIDLAVHSDTVFDIREDVRGPQFTTFIQGQQVDSWTDDQLKIGGAGFLNERDERGKVKSVSIRYLSGAGAK
jgi:hypothetical protein